MNDQWLHDLMSETAETIEPGHGLDQIRQRTAAADRRRPWAIGGSVLAAAAAVTAIAVVVSGLGDGSDSAPGPSKSPSVSEPIEPTRPAKDFVADRPGATLTGVKVTSTEGGYEISTGWIDAEGSEEEFVTLNQATGKVTREPYSDERYSQLFDLPSPQNATLPPLGDMLARPIYSMQPGLTAVIGGGDGTEGLTFERVASTSNGGETWQSFDMPTVDGQQAIFGGGVVLRDGRLLVLLTGWSGDVGGTSANHHGLWISDGADWSTLTPLELQLPGGEGDPKNSTYIFTIGGDAEGDGLLWLQYANRLFVSSGDPEDFTEVATH